VKALDNSTVKAWDNSTVEALGNSTVEAWDNSTVEAWGNSFCFVYEWASGVKAELKSNTAILRIGNKVIMGSALKIETGETKS
jgi:hypothetical protein